MRGKRAIDAFQFTQTTTVKLTAMEKTRIVKERKRERAVCNRRETEIEARGGWMEGAREREREREREHREQEEAASD